MPNLTNKWREPPLKTIRTLDDVEIVKFLGYFEREPLSVARKKQMHRDRLICLLMLDAGLRVGEVVRLSVKDLYLGGEPVKAINLDYGLAEKGCSRLIPTTTRLRDAISLSNLDIWVPDELSPLDSPFLTKNDIGPITPRQIQRMTKKVGIVTINREVNPHMLRHTFGTRVMRTCSAPVVQRLLGHRSLQSTQVYMHPNTGDLQKAINGIE